MNLDDRDLRTVCRDLYTTAGRICVLSDCVEKLSGVKRVLRITLVVDLGADGVKTVTLEEPYLTTDVAIPATASLAVGIEQRLEEDQHRASVLAQELENRRRLECWTTRKKQNAVGPI